MVLAARAAGISFSTASIMPQRMPMSRLPRSDWLGSSTSPPLITRSNLSFGPIAAWAPLDAAATAADPVTFRKSRRENPVIATLPRYDFLFGHDAPRTGVPQAGRAASHAKPMEARRCSGGQTRRLGSELSVVAQRSKAEAKPSTYAR